MDEAQAEAPVVVPEVTGEPAPAAVGGGRLLRGRKRRGGVRDGDRRQERPEAGEPGGGDGATPPDPGHPLHPFFKKMMVFKVDREKLNPAPYNPRLIDAAAQVNLKNGLRRFGMVEPVIANVRTGNVVAGHQRLKLMDQEWGRESGYAVEVSWVDLTETEEKELNVLLNNPGAQGWWDWSALARLVASDKEFDAQLAGFDAVQLQADLKAFAPDVLATESFEHVFGKPDAPDDAKADAETIRAMKAKKGEYRAAAGEAAKDGFYLQLVFGTVAEKEKFCEAVGVNPLSKTALGRQVCKQLRVVAPGEACMDIGYDYPADPAQEPAPPAEGVAETPEEAAPAPTDVPPEVPQEAA